MARVDLVYARSLLRVAEPGDLLRVVARRVGDKLSRASAPLRLDGAALRDGADALVRAPRIFTAEPIERDYRVLFPDAVLRLRTRAEAILRHQIDIFGVARAVGERI
ncbi:MAG: hypothetical protein ACXVCV_08350, partial [Polyangia bacterium]